MIIFDLDGTLADCEHRRHFVDRNHPINEKRRLSEISLIRTPEPDCNPYTWKPDWKAFYEACDQDKPIKQTIKIMQNLAEECKTIQIWSGRCESVMDKTIWWLHEYVGFDFYSNGQCPELKMRPIGDNIPDDVLKERWLDEAIAEGKTIDFVFDDRKKVRDMWIRRGIFVFDVSQGKGDF